ncbi:MAG: hypothetical protein DRN14_04840 [Thermoplasmata archaeon]|nr:MAG: hypothetical protein DRN14_04840 [Thermoplasmata archaeon]
MISSEVLVVEDTLITVDVAETLVLDIIHKYVALVWLVNAINVPARLVLALLAGDIPVKSGNRKVVDLLTSLGVKVHYYR